VTEIILDGVWNAQGQKEFENGNFSNFSYRTAMTFNTFVITGITEITVFVFLI
jgi:hypothetical protein